MYGGEVLNHHLILRYGLTKEFFETFRSLRYRELELPLLLINYYYGLIQPIVDHKRFDSLYIERKNYAFKSMEDIQRVLHRGPTCVRDLSTVAHRKAVLMPATYLPFALKQLYKHPVILTITSKKDEKAIREHPVPSNFEIYYFRDTVKKTKISPNKKQSLEANVSRIIKSKRGHEIFGSPGFQTWIVNKCITAMKEIKVLENLIRQKNIGVILENTELASPGNILALLAIKYNLPLINIQQYLTTDASIIPSRASHYCVWGDNCKMWLISKGIAEKKIIPVGNLRFEMEKITSTVNRAELMKQLNLPIHHQVIIFTTQPFPNEINKAITHWLEKAVKNQPYSVIIKNHPNDHTDYSSYVYNKNIVLNPSTFNLYDLLKNADYCMTISSNTAIEAAMLEKGILVLQPEIEYDFFRNYNDYHQHLVKASAGYVIHNEKELIEILIKLDQDPVFKRNLTGKSKVFLDATLKLGGTPSYRIRKIIQSLLKNKK